MTLRTIYNNHSINMRQRQPANQCYSLKLRYNWQRQCWEVWNYLSRYNTAPSAWRWFQISEEHAKGFLDAHVPIEIDNDGTTLSSHHKH